ncbi:hypothetical protein [Roseibium sp. RKSG952]|uniref:hypothetical protein n=1 Tax=Roseibium sp. RKSG952 TaxID=2529384 RepID=UPI0012BC4A2E|nr:hypothetical protein [Roseibium sp. RKSG952]MTI01013.1 hypothetical protein [Roseibium sp. RKSG952]
MAQRAKLKTSARISRSNAQMTCTLNDAQVFKTLETLQDVDPDVDLVFLDGWKGLYNGVLDVLLPKLKRGAIVIGDNINLSEGKEYFARVSASNSGFITTALNRNTTISVFVDQQGEPS